MTVTSTEPVQVDARVLAPPILAYGGKSRQKTIVRYAFKSLSTILTAIFGLQTPNNGTWNM